MSDKFPHPCCRCGMCCMSETCPVACHVYGINKHTPCPAFSYNAEIKMAECLLVHNKYDVGQGKGCCIKARCFKDGEEYDFASLPTKIKITVAAGVYKKYGGNK